MVTLTSPRAFQKQRELDRVTANYTQLGMVSNYLLPDFYQKIRLSLEKAERDKPTFLEEGNLLFHSTDTICASLSLQEDMRARRR